MGAIHHLNVGCADASVIKTASATFLVDCHDIDSHKSLLPSDRHLRGVFVTHQHNDHFSGLDYLKHHRYTIDCLIYSPYRRRPNDPSVTADEWDNFNDHVEYFKGKGTKTYRPYRQSSFAKPFWKTNGASFWMVGPPNHLATASDRELHDACLVIKLHTGKRKCLFTGDASEESLEWIAANTSHICDDILHASHHGSLTGAPLRFVKKCAADYTVISTREGVYENVPHTMALRRYRDHTKRVYRTDKEGSLKWSF